MHRLIQSQENHDQKDAEKACNADPEHDFTDQIRIHQFVGMNAMFVTHL
jgi:hypothetical protein